MKKTLAAFALSLLLINLSFGQDTETSDFFELGLKSSSFIESSFLENSKYREQLSDPNTEAIGLMASPTGKIYSAKLRYGKTIFSKTHLITELGFSKLDEQVMCFCHVCDKIANASTLVSLNAINAGIGIRNQILKMNNLNFSIEAIGNYSILSNESGITYFGYAIQPVFGYQFNERLSTNFKIGYEQSFNDYNKKEKYFEFAINYQIKKKES